MKASSAAVISAFCAGTIVAVLGIRCPESWEPGLYWSMPLFHKVFPPWTAGPNPKAAGCALIVDAVILTGVFYWALRSIRTQSAGKS